MLYPLSCYPFRTSTFRRDKPILSTSTEDLDRIWDWTKKARGINTSFPPLVYTFYHDYIEFLMQESFYQVYGLEYATRFLMQQLINNPGMLGGSVSFQNWLHPIGCLYFWKNHPSLLRLADKNTDWDYAQVRDYTYTQGKYVALNGAVYMAEWLHYLRRLKLNQPIFIYKNNFAKDHNSIINELWKMAAHKVKNLRERITSFASALVVVFHDVIKIYDLSPYTYSFLAGMALTKAIDSKLSEPGSLAHAIIAVQKDSPCNLPVCPLDRESYYLVMRYSSDNLYTIRSSKLYINSTNFVTLEKPEESIAHAKE